MTVTRRLTVDAVLKMATAAAQEHADALPDRSANAELSEAISATWELVKRRLGSSKSAALHALINKISGKAGGVKLAKLDG